jgi:hypothetical protein
MLKLDCNTQEEEEEDADLMELMEEHEAGPSKVSVEGDEGEEGEEEGDDEGDDEGEEEGLAALLQEEKESEEGLANVAALASSVAQPTGWTLATTQVKTTVPFLLKHTMREYQVLPRLA